MVKKSPYQRKDIAVQDENNTLYLYSNSGIYWKKQLSGKIQGAIQQVDLYKNGRLQMAFRTENRFYVLDRNGKVVPPFDKKVSSEAPVHPWLFLTTIKAVITVLCWHKEKVFKCSTAKESV